MDAATASDNCGEVTIEEVSETIAGDCAGSYTIVRTNNDDQVTSFTARLRLRPSRWRTRRFQSSRAFLPTPNDLSECS